MTRVAWAILRRPDLWPTAARVARRTAPPGWYRRRPFLPMPAGDYLDFRMSTQYGETSRQPDPDDVLDYLTWCREWDRSGG